MSSLLVLRPLVVYICGRPTITAANPFAEKDLVSWEIFGPSVMGQGFFIDVRIRISNPKGCSGEARLWMQDRRGEKAYCERGYFLWEMAAGNRLRFTSIRLAILGR